MVSGSASLLRIIIRLNRDLADLVSEWSKTCTESGLQPRQRRDTLLRKAFGCAPFPLC